MGDAVLTQSDAHTLELGADQIAMVNSAVLDLHNEAARRRIEAERKRGEQALAWAIFKIRQCPDARFRRGRLAIDEAQQIAEILRAGGFEIRRAR